MNRRDARILVMQYIFQMDAQKDFTVCALDGFLSDKNITNQKAYILNTIDCVCQHIDDIDSNINQCAEGWSINRIAKVDLSILRLATAEILYVSDIPKSVSINEAVELAKLYSDDKSPKFINAVLKNIGQ